ncbi:cytochrome P450 [Novosphingobium sp. PS1R-30]|uniref:Cytochrome P450 n=1 Tax=Novosphingobium anseongense TaxID=3133436 RepID=A0ABU8S3P6_9SPHN
MLARSVAENLSGGFAGAKSRASQSRTFATKFRGLATWSEQRLALDRSLKAQSRSAMTTLAQRDYFTDHAILVDPYSYFEAVREGGPVQRRSDGIVVVTGFEESLEVLRNTADFSSANAPQGPNVPLAFEPDGDDITAQIEAHRGTFYGGTHLVAYDDDQHTFSRSLINRLFTPSRLKANERFIAEFADELARDAVARGGCDLIGDIATPFVTLVIADLLGVPAEDRSIFMEAIKSGPPPGSLDPEDLKLRGQSLVIMGRYFAEYVAGRRAAPRDDILSELAAATFPDGSLPEVAEIVRLATFLFGAGQDTSAKLLGNTMRYLVERPELQQAMRDDPAQIPDLIEEVLRLEGSSKMTARLVRRKTMIAGLEVRPGDRIFVALAAANRDPRRWERPDALVLGRPKVKEHVAFGRGAHVCAGAPLARVEVRMILERFLAHTRQIELDEAVHGPRGNHRLDYEPSFLIRGLSRLQLKLTTK